MSEHSVYLVLVGETAPHRAELFRAGCVDAFVSPHDDMVHTRFQREARTPIEAMSGVIHDVEAIPRVYAVMVENDSQSAAAIINAALALRNTGAALRDDERQTIRRLGIRDFAEVADPDHPPAHDADADAARHDDDLAFATT
ncbi:MAG TPA: hypothetical protein VF533_00775 [Solirubrobacteraceae bacterium]|jgi:hypothetical protein